MNALVTTSLGLALLGMSAAAQERAPEFPAEQIKKGADLFARNCATCHGTRMRNPQWAVDLRTFPRDGHARFVDAVANGKRNMPAWDDVLDPEQIEAIWAYVIAGEAGEERRGVCGPQSGAAFSSFTRAFSPVCCARASNTTPAGGPTTEP